AEADLGLNLSTRFDDQHDLLVWAHHAADVLGKSTFQSNIHRADQATGRELRGVAGVEEHGTAARTIAGSVDRQRGRVLVLAQQLVVLAVSSSVVGEVIR